MPGLPHLAQTRQEGESCYYMLSIFIKAVSKPWSFSAGLAVALNLNFKPSRGEDELFTLNFLYNNHGHTVPILSRT